MSIQSEIQNLINSILLPLLGLIIIVGAIIGVAKNFDAINDSSGSGRRKEGLISVVYIVGYVIIVCAILGLVVSKIANLKLTI